MMQEQEAVSQVMNYAFKGGEMAVRISGAAAKNLMVLIEGILTEKYKTGGAERLRNLIREGTPIKVFPLEKGLLKDFTALARKAGVTFSVIQDKDKLSAGVDIFIKDTDSARVNYILEKVAAHKILESATIESTPVREEDRGTEEYQKRRKVYEPSIQPEQENPTKDRGSESRSDSSSVLERTICNRPSVKQKLAEIRKNLQNDLLQGAQERSERLPIIPKNTEKEER